MAGLLHRRRLMLSAAGLGIPAAACGAGRKLNRAALEPTFADEFGTFSRHADIAGGRRGTWRTVYGYGGPRALSNRAHAHHGDLQVYMDPEFAGPEGGEPLGINPFSIVDGVLRIEAKATPPEVRPRLWDRPYTSGLITSRFSFSQLHGYFEMRARLPAGKGFWTAFWLLPANDQWPPELDVVEVLGREPGKLYATIHQTRGHVPGADNPNKSHVVQVADTSAGFHTYGASWERDYVHWFFDDQEVARQPTPPSMNTPMFILLNLSVGGGWPGNPDASTRFPAYLEVDWIRAYKLNGPPVV